MKYKLSEVMDLIGGGTPKTSKPEYWNGDIPWLSVKDFNNGFRYVYETEKSITQLGLENSSTKLLQKGDVIISARGTVGEIATIPFPMAFNQSCYGLRAKSGIVTSDYLYYLIKHNVSVLKKNTHGSVFDTITRSTFDNIVVEIPSIEIQEKIASILSDYDEKIELNNAINNNLEQQAMAIFNNLFPFNTGSKYTTLGSVTTNIRERIGDRNAIVLSAVNIGKLQPSDEFFNKRVYSKDISKYIIVKEGAFAYNPARINIGSIGINDLCSIGCVSPVYVVFTVDDDYQSFFEFYFKTENFRAETMLRASGSVRQSLNYSDFALIKMQYPDRKTAKYFNDFWLNQKRTIMQLKNENAKLSELRDTLLPKLMSGELDVSNIEF